MGSTRMTRTVRRLALSAASGICLALACTGIASASIGSYTTRGAWSFVSAAGLHPPKLFTAGSVNRRALSGGDFLLDIFPQLADPGPMTGQGGPLILDSRLRPVWFHSVGSKLASSDLQQETYAGKPVLVWWQGQLTNTGATKSGQVVVVDQHYRPLATLRAKAPWTISLHDAVINGTDIWVTVYRYLPGQNLSTYGGPKNGTVYDAGVQEYDLSTGALLYTWDALNPGGIAHVPLSASEQPAADTPSGQAWDAYHVNSIQVLPGNQILVSMRNTWAAYLINVPTGAVVWTLGGKDSTFKFAGGARFAWQHDVQLVGADEVTLFADNCCLQRSNGSYVPPATAAEGMVLKLNLLTLTASLAAAYTHSPALTPAYLGSTTLLPNGNALIGWGSRPYFSEYAGSGRRLLDVYYPYKDLSYRALFSSTWVGTPYYPPRGAARRVHSKTIVYASWNGATQVAAWQVLGGRSAAHLKRVGHAVKNGFETALTLRNDTYKVFKVQPLDAHGHVLGSSAAFRVS